jgi:tetratricopeptide (TPR) repeat protein
VTAVVVLVLVESVTAQRPPAADPLARARDAMLHGQYAEAEELLTPLASRTNPNDAALELGLLLRQLGRRQDSDRWLEAIVASTRVSSAADYVRIGRAAQAAGDVRRANEAFQDAAQTVPKDVELNVAWGRLFLQTHNRAEAARSFQIALEADPKSAAAQVGLAEALADENPPAALGMARKAIAIDPSFIPAHLLVAELMLDRSQHDDAQKSIALALEVNPSSLEAHSLRAAIAYLEGRQDAFQAEVALVRRINPQYGEIYRVAAEHAASSYRFAEAAILTRQAFAIDPDDSRALADLGVHLLRTGDEDGARRSLDRAFKADPYDTITFNLLSLLDTLEKFQTIRAGDVIMRLDPDEAAIMREYAIPLAQEALAAVSKRYEFQPQGPILIEIFPKHDDFAVRNVGLPGMIGALGACFGRVVTMDSPRARPPGSFNWASTLWHELTHVVTLQMSNQRVPRWLTEGVSVFEEKRAAASWGRESDIMFAQALQRGRTIPLKELNAAFTDPERINLAYYEASLLAEHIVAVYGQSALNKLLRTYGEGVEGEEALKQGLGVETNQLQASFTASIAKTYKPLVDALAPPPGFEGALGDPARLADLARTSPGSYLAQLALGEALQKAGDLDGAMAALGRAAQLVPGATGKESPHAIMAEIAMTQNDRTRATAELEALLVHDDSNVDAARRLVSLLGADADSARLTAAYEKVVALDPFDPVAHAALGKLLAAGRDYDTAIREFRAALASKPADPAATHCDLADAYVAVGQVDQAKRQTLAALEIAPSYERAQDLLLKLVEAPK